MEAISNASYKIHNVVKCRQEVTYYELKLVLDKLEAYISNCGAKKVANIITVTHVLYLDTKVFDVEVFVPIDKAIPSTNEFIYMPKFSLENCVMTNYNGHPHLLPVLYSDLYHKAKDMGLEIEPLFYNVLKGDSSLWRIYDFEADVYTAIKK